MQNERDPHPTGNARYFLKNTILWCHPSLDSLEERPEKEAVVLPTVLCTAAWVLSPFPLVSLKNEFIFS